MKLITRAGLVATAFAVFGLGFENYWTASAQECEASEGRSYSPSVSVHPNDRDLLFSECANSAESERGCVVLSFDQQAKKLGRYDLPGGYNYKNPSFSPSGKWIVAERRPEISPDMDEAQWQEINRQSEIVMFRTDGTQFTVLPLAPGYKTMAVMSRDDKHVAFYRGRVLPLPIGRSNTKDKDVWEFDLADGKEHLFAAEYQFSNVGAAMQYLDADTLLVNASWPFAVVSDDPFSTTTSAVVTYEKLHNDSKVYRLRRGEKEHVAPVQTGFDSAHRASADHKGNLYFQGFGQREVLHRLSADGKLSHAMLPDDMLNLIVSMTAIPSGGSLACVLACGSVRWGKGLHKIALLDFETVIFTPVRIPPLRTSYRIAVIPSQ